jgi:hypothetical protein
MPKCGGAMIFINFHSSKINVNGTFGGNFKKEIS